MAVREKVEKASLAQPSSSTSGPDPSPTAEGDMITSKVIPLALSGVAIVLLVPGLFKMYLGIHD